MAIDPSRPILVLTGAGISVESGLPSFRGPDGLWEGWRLEDVATPEAFAREPRTVQRFYNERRRSLLAASVAPNPAHRALARLAAFWPGGLVLVTQNIDDLHERGGCADVLHMHGELLKVRCLNCDVTNPWRDDVAEDSACPSCGEIGDLRPHVVWFGEMPLGLDDIEAAIRACGLFVAIGTSGQVYPAAGFVDAVRRAGRAHTIEINLDASAVASAFAEVRRGPAGVLVPALVDQLLAGLV